MAAPFLARPSAARMGCLIALSVPFILFGLFGLLHDPTGSAGLVGVVNLLFWGSLAGLAVARLRNPKPVIRIDEEGIYSRSWSDEVIAWQDIELIEPGTVHGSMQCLVIHLHAPEKYPPSGGLGRIAGNQKKPEFGDIPLSPVGTDKSWNELKDAISRYLPRLD